MRAIGLLLILLLFSATMFAADRDRPQQSSPDTSLISGLNLTSPELDSASREYPEPVGPHGNASWGRYRRLQDRRNSFCATMRTYIVAREERGSDATNIVGYARCLPAWKFQLRTADEKMSDSSR